MGLFSFLRKNKQDAAPGKTEFRSQSDEPFTNARSRAKRGKDVGADPMLPEKKRARRRLIGAVVLVLAVVIVLPMILDPDPKPVADDIAIQIPSRDSKTPSAADQQAAAAGLGPTEELVQAKPAEKAVGKAAENMDAVGKPAEKAVEGPVEKPTEKPAEEKPADRRADRQADRRTERPTEKLAEKPAARPAPAPARAEPAAEPKRNAPAAAGPTEEERALAILQGKPLPADKGGAAKSASKPAGKFVIQVAALATQEKVDELRQKLAAAGVKSYTQKVATQAGERTRIRVGPFASREEADKARAKITHLGLNATVIPT
jgi:DedD protein